jgi:transcription elongation factor GreA
MTSANLMTAADLEALRAELEQLETEGRAEIASNIKTAREWGDLKENAEYHAAKNAQAHLETRIATLRARIVSAEVVQISSGDVVGFGSLVTVTDASGRSREHRLVAASDADPVQGRLSFDSPVARALTGHRAGETVTVVTPRGPQRLTIDAVA